MCAVSAVSDDWTRRNRRKIDRILPYEYPYSAPKTPNWEDVFRTITKPDVSRDEFDALKKEVQELREELIKAKERDFAEGNPDCEMDEKVRLLKQIADFVGVDLSEVFGARG